MGICIELAMIGEAEVERRSRHLWMTPISSYPKLHVRLFNIASSIQSLMFPPRMFIKMLHQKFTAIAIETLWSQISHCSSSEPEDIIKLITHI